jgi:outer membrane protein OmpA-like peptidoglycan-associated protein
MGAGGSQTASTSVGVTAPPPPPAPPVERLTLRINFDTNKATIRQADVPELQKAVEFAKRYPGRTISIDGMPMTSAIISRPVNTASP